MQIILQEANLKLLISSSDIPVERNKSCSSLANLACETVDGREVK
ncbi:hypothetical protein HanXRQr2_Chr16g0773581 [Helianthus annuus]|uniref:Uncharacterized protein n=1 Tax=Helianthus annuus TaxID=4232 RepID=A0A9K3DVB5_HELAN|nr:hypothetical protein HanXRQr2_Chr16g0773581 [Helianthus annuus]